MPFTFDISHEDRTTLACTRVEAEALGYPADMIDAAEARAEALAQRTMVRMAIAEQVADTESLLGTTADALAVLLVETMRMASALSTAQSLAEMRAAAEPLTTLTADLLAAIDTGAARFPYQDKGTEAVFAEIKERCTGVADILASTDGQV